ncbi:transglutaminase-like cysteine peptidase [Sphingomonas naphthae]|uniref:Transglutaminase-like cysteine peptidase n=1 Tax=Sphingomonas naphthae TaxID=1813468 RepID=A0ABY7TH85_9SPHN|nr:transglutaminase-like cysteine peptidase [Sphingomonas naphthae]WCT72072.1 transglutaminase-like cysteine peptidase [Sphingomonas naphthae]
MHALTAAQRRELAAVNLRVNHASRQLSDLATFGVVEHWEPARPGTGADCEDMALAKQAELVRLGWPVGDVRLAVCWTETAERHCVVTVESGGNTIVLDNRRDRIVDWAMLKRLGYRGDRRESAASPTGWALFV